MKEDNYLSNLSKKKGNRIFAWICLFIILGLFITTAVMAITGSKYYMAMLLITIIVPVFMYIILWLGRVLNGSGYDEEITDKDTSNKVD